MHYTIGEYYCPFCGKKLYEKNRRISGTGHMLESVTVFYLCGNCDTKIEHHEEMWEASILDMEKGESD